jgi:hypothetical protein
MALDALVLARYGGSSSQYLANLTRNFDPDGAGTVDTVLLGLACDDVTGDFEMEAGTVYDDDPTTNPTTFKSHRSVGVMCVVIKLQLWTGKLPDKIAIQMTKMYEKLLEKLGKICGRDRFEIQSSSPFEESDQTDPSGEPILPPFDDEIMNYFIPNAGSLPSSSFDRRVNLP